MDKSVELQRLILEKVRFRLRDTISCEIVDSTGYSHGVYLT